MELKPEGVFSISDFDVTNVLDKAVKISQEQLHQIAGRTKKYISRDVGDEFWDAFDNAIREASLEVLYPDDNL